LNQKLQELLTLPAVIKFLQEVFSRQGVPEVIITDNGRQFIADITKKLQSTYMEHGSNLFLPVIQKKIGQVENANREIVKVLRHICEKQIEWDNFLFFYFVGFENDKVKYYRI